MLHRVQWRGARGIQAVFRFGAALAFCSCLFAGRASAETQPAGQWQGSLHVLRDLRLVMRFSRDGEGHLEGTFYSLDQGGQPYQMSEVRFQGQHLHVAIPLLNASYDANLRPDGTLLAGMWKQGLAEYPLNFAHTSEGKEWAIPSEHRIVPMAANVNPNFSVATIKPSRMDAQGTTLLLRARRFEFLNVTLSDVIAFAYDLQARQVRNGPAWAKTDRFDIVAQPDEAGEPDLRQWKTMCQKLLAERFHLQFHTLKVAMPVYELRVSSSPKGMDPSRLTGETPTFLFRKPGDLAAGNASMTDFARLLQANVLDRPVLDETQLKGRWNFALRWVPNGDSLGQASPLRGDAETQGLPGLFTAVKEQLGIRLAPVVSKAEVLSIDHTERASAN